GCTPIRLPGMNWLTYVATPRAPTCPTQALMTRAEVACRYGRQRNAPRLMRGPLTSGQWSRSERHSQRGDVGRGGLNPMPQYKSRLLVEWAGVEGLQLHHQQPARLHHRDGRGRGKINCCFSAPVRGAVLSAGGT